jgi:hypothetical protein
MPQPRNRNRLWGFAQLLGNKGEVLNSRPDKNAKLRLAPARSLPDPALCVLGEVAFQRIVSLEKKRTERSGKPCLLMLLDAGDGILLQRKRDLLGKVVAALVSFTRETDVTGWYKQDRIAGVMFTEVNPDGLELILKTMLGRLKETLATELSSQQLTQINISFRLFPEIESGPPERPGSRLYHLSSSPSAPRRDTPPVS